jgi:hypothetical protein
MLHYSHRHGSRENWAKLYGKLASAVGYKWHILVRYGYDRNVFGERVMFKNEGTYYKLSDAKQAFGAFIEK